jgi:hypothetical protein
MSASSRRRRSARASFWTLVPQEAARHVHPLSGQRSKQPVRQSLSLRFFLQRAHPRSLAWRCAPSTIVRRQHRRHLHAPTAQQRRVASRTEEGQVSDPDDACSPVPVHRPMASRRRSRRTVTMTKNGIATSTASSRSAWRTSRSRRFAKPCDDLVTLFSG